VAGVVQDHDVPPRVDRHAEDLAEVHVGRVLERAMHGLERDLRGRLLRDRRLGEERGQSKEGDEAFHGESPEGVSLTIGRQARIADYVAKD
jgi:hypothetical protein